jgi:hypothetical protein
VTVRARRRPLVPRLAFIFPVAAALAACLPGVPGYGCGTEEARAFNEIAHYGDRPLVPAESQSLCSASFTDDAPAAEVVEHYRSELVSEGWEILGAAGRLLGAQRTDPDLLFTLQLFPAPEAGQSGDPFLPLEDGANGGRYEILLGEAPPIDQ